MKDAIITIQNGYFDFEMKDNDFAMKDSIQTLISTMLFTRPWWANSESGSTFEDEASAINTNESKKNIENILRDIKSTLMHEKLVSEFSYEMNLNAEDVILHCKWKNFATNSCEKYQVIC